MTFPRGRPARTFRGYAANMLYVSPDHRDRGGIAPSPAAWPYMVISQGSSGSDQPFLRALAMTMVSTGSVIRFTKPDTLTTSS